MINSVLCINQQKEEGTYQLMNDNFESFDYVNLAEIDPNQELLPANMYTLKILKAELKSGVSKATNEPYTNASFTFAVQDDPTYSGRRLWESFWPNSFGLKALRRIMDATGIQQAPGQPLEEWLKDLSIQQPTFKVPVKNEEDIDYKTKKPRSFGPDGVTPARKNSLNVFNIVPA